MCINHLTDAHYGVIKQKKGEIMKRFKNQLQHTVNELHIYCRLRDLGLSKKRSIVIAKVISLSIYKLAYH